MSADMERMGESLPLVHRPTLDLIPCKCVIQECTVGVKVSIPPPLQITLPSSAAAAAQSRLLVSYDALCP